MYIIRAFNNEAEKRDWKLSKLIDEGENKSINSFNYVTNRNGYTITNNIVLAKVYKTETGATKFIETVSKFNEKKSSRTIGSWNNKFFFLRNKILHIDKLSKKEYNDIIDHKISLEKSLCERKVRKLEKQKR